MKLSRVLLAGVLMLLPGVLHAADPFVGRWELDVKSSRFAAGACPKSMTIEMTEFGDGVRYHSVTELQTGRSFTADYAAAYNDVPVQVTGARGILLPVSLHRESARVVVASYISGGGPSAVSRRMVSEDGKSMTVTTTSRDGSGREFKNVGVYRRVPVAAKLAALLSEIKTQP